MNRSQSIPRHLRFTLDEFNRSFPDNDSCLEFIKEKLFPEGITFCKKCKQYRKHHHVIRRPEWGCDYCGSMISPMAGIIFEEKGLARCHRVSRRGIWGHDTPPAGEPSPGC